MNVFAILTILSLLGLLRANFSPAEEIGNSLDLSLKKKKILVKLGIVTE